MMRSAVVVLAGSLLAGCISVPAILAPPDAPSQDANDPPVPRTLIIALDAVPFDSAVKAFAKSPELARFGDPVPVVSTFPSSTTLAFTEMFRPVGLGTPPGYEAKFYDASVGRIRGGGLMSYGKIEFSWREFFDWKTDGALRKAVGYARPRAFSRAEFRRGINAFLSSDQQAFYLYVGSTDGVAHLAGPQAFVEVLTDLAAVLEEARRSQPSFRTVLLSDHGVGGGEPLRNVRAPVIDAARAAGLRSAGALERPGDIVFVPFGLLSSFVAFTDPDDTHRAVRALGRVAGVGLCAAPEGTDGFLLVDPEGEARLERRSNAGRIEWRYTPDGGDPLLWLAAGLSANAWTEDSVVFESTVSGARPDGPRRVAEAFELVRNPATIVCSTAPGFMYGAALTEFSGRVGVGRLRWTHGALERDDTLGFVATDLPKAEALRLRPALRASELVEILGLDEPSLQPSKLRQQLTGEASEAPP
ncbi:MAG: hypothetical protein AAGK22_00660 [Acidobacteriota bacterium]